MEADLSRLPTGTSGWLALASHAASLGDLSEVDWLELKSALPFTERQGRKRSAVVLSRAILGMANRMPDSAQKHLGGYGVVFVGIDKQTVVGAEQVDGAVLRDAVEAYVGEDGPRWDHQFIDHPDGLVLALVIDPPQWGDRIHACRKDYSADDTKLAVRDGEVFVRAPGSTRPATSYDLSQLELRRTRAPHTGAEVLVEYDGTFDHILTENVREFVESVVDDEAEDLLSELPSDSPSYPYGLTVQPFIAQMSGLGDRRSPERFRADVKEWQNRSKELRDEVVNEFFRHHLARGHLLIRNESDRYLEGVRVQVRFPPGAVVLMGSDTDYCDHGGQFQVLQLLPDRPPKYGSLQYDIANFAMPRFNPISPSVSAATSPFDAEETPDGYLVTWHVGDLPSRGAETGDEPFAVITDDHVQEIIAIWSVTARGVHHVFRGEMHLQCEQAPGEHLVWVRHCHE